MAKRTPKSDIRMWLAGKGKPQEWLALKLGISPSALSRLLAGYRTPTPELAKAIKRMTGVDLMPPPKPIVPTERTESW